MPRSPLPLRHGLDAAWVHTGRDDAYGTMGAFLRTKLAVMEDSELESKLADGGFVWESGRSIDEKDAFRPHQLVFFHRELREEAEVPFALEVIHEDERIVVVDKPHFLSTIPRGRHVAQSVVVRARQQLGIPTLTPAHRLDRVTAGVLLLTREPRFRGPYQQLFDQRIPQKEYEAVADAPGDLDFPMHVRSHLHKTHGIMRVDDRDDLPANAATTIDVLEDLGRFARYRVTPHTGRTHQIRAHMLRIGRPILHDPLYPEPLSVDIDDFSRPIGLLARELRFVDPLDGAERVFRSARELDVPVDD